MNRQRESLQTLPIGTRVYYTGDMANQPATGTIVSHDRNARFGDSVTIEWDAEEEKPDTTVGPVNFETGPGTRFHRLEDWERQRRERFNEIYGTGSTV